MQTTLQRIQKGKTDTDCEELHENEVFVRFLFCAFILKRKTGRRRPYCASLDFATGSWPFINRDRSRASWCLFRTYSSSVLRFGMSASESSLACEGMYTKLMEDEGPCDLTLRLEPGGEKPPHFQSGFFISHLYDCDCVLLGFCTSQKVERVLNK